MSYFVFKFIHVFFIISWFAGLFYLPRIFVNLAMAENDVEYARLLLMAKKLFKFMTPWGIGAILMGLLMPTFYIGFPVWIHIKITLALLLVAYHIWCGIILRQFINRSEKHSHRWFRVFNELPVFILLAELYVVIFRPFS